MPQSYNQRVNQSGSDVSCVGTVLNAAVCGAAGWDCLLRFDNVVNSDPTILLGATGVNGTLIAISAGEPGIYACSLTYATAQAGTINNVGIVMNAADFATDPGMATVGILDYASTLSVANQDIATKLIAYAVVTPAAAAIANTISFHAGDGANTTPLNTDVILAECRFEVRRIAEVT